MPKVGATAEVELRVNTVFELMLIGLSHAEILRYAAEKTDWNVSKRGVEYYITRAKKRLVEAGKAHREEEFGRALSRLNKLYQNCVKVQDWKAALAMQKEINSLLGLYAPTQVTVNWREEFARVGLDPATEFEKLVNVLVDRSGD